MPQDKCPILNVFKEQGKEDLWFENVHGITDAAMLSWLAASTGSKLAALLQVVFCPNEYN
jgi:hypothetical protein